MVLSWARCCVIAAFSTERWSRQAMTARQTKMPRPNAPRMAPTAMKKVPSGILDVCM